MRSSQFIPCSGRPPLPPLLASLLLVLLGGVLPAAEPLGGDGPHWIWADRQRAAGETARLGTTFQVAQRPRRAELFVAAEYCRLEVVLNQVRLGAIEPYGDPLWLDVSAALRPGANQLAVRAMAVDGPSAVAAALTMSGGAEPPRTVVSDATWRVEPPGEASSPPAAAVRFGQVARRPWRISPAAIRIKAFDDYTQWKRALGAAPDATAAAFELPEGFQIELLRAAGAGEGSWVSLACDPQGRLIVAREDQGLLRMTLARDGGSVERVETMNDQLLECRGLLLAHDALYANANNSKGLYRLQDADGDGTYETVDLLYESSGGVGHGRNDLALGPDGLIYSIHGDAVDLPRGFVDYTSPHREHRQGVNTREGHLIRTDRQGRRWELLAAGLRNPFGIDFNADGEIFTYDADAEFDMGSPWYRPTRVNHLVPGSDFGWRGVTGNWPPYFPDHADNAPPGLDIGKGSPTAVKFGFGSAFPGPYRDALYILDWAYGRILAVHMAPRGASYFSRAEVFLRGRPLNVTDLDFAPDGAMYFVTGGRKTHSGLYRVRYVGAARDAAAPPTPQQQARSAFAARARQVRRRLEALDDDGAAAVERAWPYLAHPDPHLRHAARIALERQPADLWRERVFQETNPAAAIVGLLALARGEADQVAPRALAQLNQLPLDQLDRADLLAALDVYRRCLSDEFPVDAALRRAVAARIEPLYPAGDAGTDRLLSELLVRLQVATVVPRTLARLAASEDQAEQLQCLFVLRQAPGEWTLADRQAYFRALQQSADYLGGQGMPGFIENIRRDAVAHLTDDERTALAALIEPAAEETGGAAAAPPRPLVRKWQLDELAGSLDELGDGRDLEQGRQMFAAALCDRCHRLGTQGRAVGPDLTSVARRFSRHDLLQAILQPSLVVAENYRSSRIVTTRGQVVEGQVVYTGDYRAPVLKVATDPQQPGKLIEIPKADVESYVVSPTSFMPQGLLDTLSREEILDLLAYIESGGNPLSRRRSQTR